ncbi:MAG: peptide chain release factor N(5)-glutamine methyltransferase [Deltaproteobacteria bacterium]|nr:peptide chain release factor N(5)-glutamine methyltransferase [Deltaproteobacteria bacterium]
MNKKAQSGDHTEPWTVLRLIRWTTNYLTGKGVKKARLDSEVLLADVLGLTRVELYLNYDRPLTPSELAAFREHVRRRAAFEPVAYITGHKEFYSLEFKVNQQVLIPRPETELLVDQALTLAQTQRSGLKNPAADFLHVIDLGTGCGAIAIALAGNLSQTILWALDLSESALEVARMNAEKHSVNERITFIKGDLLEPLKEQVDYFDLIIANLPYVPRDFYNDMDPDVKDFEPRLALDGGKDGLDLIRGAIAQSHPLLRSHGALLLEIWPTHALRVREMGELHGYGQVSVLQDLTGRDRVAILMKSRPGG